MIPIGAITPHNASYPFVLWSSRIAALAAIIFAVAAATQWLAAPLVLNLAFGCAATALIMHLCLGQGGKIALLKQIGEANIQGRRELDLSWRESSSFGRLLESIKEAVDNGKDRFRYFEKVDTDIATVQTYSLDSLAGCTQRELDALLIYFKA